MHEQQTKCPMCSKGHVVWNGDASDFYFTCSRAPKCVWESGRGGTVCIQDGLKGLVGVAIHGGKVRKPKPKTAKKKHTKEVKFIPDSDEFKAELRAEIARRMDMLVAEREKFPPTNILVGKGKKAKLVPNPKFTEKMRQHLHKFYVDSAEIREELLNA